MRSKNYSILTLFVLFIGFTLNSSLSAQTASFGAGINSKWEIRIESKTNIKEPVKINSASIPFVTAAVAEEICLSISDNLLTFTYAASERTLVLKLNQYEGAPVKTVADWNAYLLEQAPKFLRIYSALNK